jgi:DNA-binding CsgD family transcriptional regulator
LAVRLPGEELLIGREAERAALDALAAEARAGDGAIVLLAGEAGVGKTMLARAVVAGSGLDVAMGFGVQEGASAYGPIVEALRALTAAGAAPPLRSHLAMLLPELAPDAAPVDRATLFEAIRSLLASAAVRRPLALFLDDMQWADDATLDLLHGVGAPFERMESERRAASALLMAGRRDDAVERLAGAYRLARRMRARPSVQRLAASLAGLGEQADRRLSRRQAEQLDHQGLTRRELGVLRLLAVGMTNREIAAELIVSPRTVDMHVRNILRKLDCRARADAARRASELGLLGPAAASESGTWT